MNNNISDQNSYSARIYGQSGALRDLLEKIDDPKIITLEDVLQFRKNYAGARQKMLNDGIAQVKLQIQAMKVEKNQLMLEKEDVIKKKSGELNQRISCLESGLTSSQQCGFVVGVFCKMKRWMLDQRIKYYKNRFSASLRSIAKDYDKRMVTLENKIKHAENNTQTVAEDNISSELRRLDRINNTCETEKYLIYGAIGETNVINVLKKLPKAYHIINDLRIHFYKPIYNRAENDRIFSIQADHVVVGPTGLFIIETKYWSDQSIANEMLFSPVKQVKRVGFALFVFLNDAVKSGLIKGLVNNWGERKISPKKIIASVNIVPYGEFQYVKVLGIDKVNSHITYGKVDLSADEVQGVVDYLLHVKSA